MLNFRPRRFSEKFSPPVAARKVLAGWMSGLGEALDALVFPWSCAICGIEGVTGPFCEACREELLKQSSLSSASVCPRCALQVGPFADLRGGCASCRGHSLGFDASFAMGSYEGELRDLCLRLKHERNAWLARWLSDLFVDARRDAFSNLPSNALVVPVPLHWWRHWGRGYNQAEALAEGMARRLKLPVRRLLRRVVATRKLAELGVTARGEIVRNVFRTRTRFNLAGRTVLLVDDVLTTGATCGAAARALKQAGAARVVVAVVARTERTTL
jgi:ComF family protein